MERGQRARSEATTATPRREGGAALRPPRYGVTVIDTATVQAAAMEPVSGLPADRVVGIAARGLTGPAGPLPHLEAVQRSFGRHDLSHVRAYTGGAAAASAAAIGARAYTVGSQVAFRGSPSLHTAAHEAAHVVQQTAVVRLDGGVGQVGDRYEAHADAVADAVARGDSAEPLLDAFTAGQRGGGETAVQRAVGFEFQTSWGLVRSLKAAPSEPVRERATKPRPGKQEDWEDVKIEHAGPTPWWWQVAPTPTEDENPKHKASPSSPVNQWDNKKKRPTKTTYMDPESGSVVAHPTRGRTHYKFHKGQVIKDYGGFKMTVDDAGTPLGAELEWVIDPPIDESKEPKDVEELFARLYEECENLLRFQRRESFLLSEVTRAPADASVEIQPAIKGVHKQNMEALAQATGGVSVDRIFELLEHLGDRRRAKNPTLGGQRGLLGQEGATDIVGAIHRIRGLTDLSDRLKGLLVFLVRYASMGSDPKKPLSYAKFATYYLARTDLATLFAQLPEKEALQERPEQLLGLLSQALPNRNLSLPIFAGGIHDGEGGLVRPPLTVEEWVYGITQGKDQLSSKHWQGIEETEEASMYRGLLESMGSLGDSMDKVGRSGEESGFVMEFRGNTSTRKPDRWSAYGVGIFTYLKALNRGEL